MSDNKKYYWLKLKENFFDQDTISWLEEQENGKDYCFFYLKLCLKSLKGGGLLIRKVGDMLIPYDIKHLSKITGTDYDTCGVAMKLFQKIGLVQILDNGEIYLAQLDDMVGSETDKAALMRKKRLGDKSDKGNNVTKKLPKDSKIVNQSIEKEIDIDIELEKEIDKKKTKKLSLTHRLENFKQNAFEKCSPSQDEIIQFEKFVNYFTESNDNGTKMRFEMEKIFNTSSRWSRWKSRSAEWNKQKNMIPANDKPQLSVAEASLLRFVNEGKNGVQA